MQRVVFALVALISLLTVNLRPSQAQDHPGQPVEPTSTPQQINEPVEGATTDAPQAFRTGHESDVFVINADQTVDEVTVRDKAVVLEGHVKHNVFTVNCPVTIKPGAKVGGDVVAIGGSVDNQAGRAVRVVREKSEVLSLFDGGGGTAIQALAPPPAPRAVGVTRAKKREGDWASGQFGLMVLGLLGGLILRVLAPRSTDRVADSVALCPGRCLAVGGVSALVLAAVLALNAGLMQTHTIFSLIWAPFGFVIATLPLLALACGWLCGMRHVGDMVARRFGAAPSGSLYGRMALGLIAFFLLNILLGSMSTGLGLAGLCLEFVVALMGLGALIQTGFGRDTDWLSTRSFWVRRF